MKRFIFIVLAWTISTPSFAMFMLNYPILQDDYLLQYVDLNFEAMAASAGSTTATSDATSTPVPVATTSTLATTTTQKTQVPFVQPYSDLDPVCDNMIICINIDAINAGGAVTGTETPTTGETDITKTQTPPPTTTIVPTTTYTPPPTTTIVPTTTYTPPTTSVPEPGTAGLLFLGGVVILLSRRRLWAQPQTS